eukprot:NODE_6190_length_289_cov_151.108333_g5578_i0.p1 GENE.NODE_6190_length_289_cov_151.108333_g5578_i0~~NODE_6190_length_289_cov_151.108333_g5578_i0.p1  ORF type:complete len:66 (-),score=23.42 NODE_6190_length_289_cov_151.108333_g5578_i0:92-259(-)
MGALNYVFGNRTPDGLIGVATGYAYSYLKDNRRLRTPDFMEAVFRPPVPPPRYAR